MRATLVLGAINGLTFALLAIGLVLVYKSSRFINVAHAQLGVVSSMVLTKLVYEWGASWWLAFPLAVALGAGVGGAVELLVIRRLVAAGRSRVSLLIASIGLSQLLLSLTYFRWLGANPVEVTNRGYPLPFHVDFGVDRLRLNANHLLIIILVPTLAAGLTVLLRSTRIGKAVRAAASNPDAAALAGISVRRVATVSWMLAGGLAAVSAILVAPGQPSSNLPAFGPTLLLRAMGAAALGGFTSLPLACAAGLGLGVIEAVALYFTHNAGNAEVVIFVIILLGLFVRSRAIEAAARGTQDRVEVEEGRPVIPPAVADRFVVRRARALLVSAGLLLGVLLPLLPPFRPSSKTFILTLVLVYALVAISVVVLTGWGCEVSLGQFAFLGAGAFVGGRLILNGWSLPAVLVICGAMGAGLAVLIGLPALRLSGLTLAVTTLGFAVIGPSWLFRQPWFAPDAVLNVPGPRVAGLGTLDSQRGVYYATLVVLALVALAVGALRRASPGRRMIAVRDNRDGASAFGFSPTAIKLGTFALSGFIACAAGVLWLGAYRNLSVDLIGPQNSFLMLALPVIGGLASVPGAILGSALIFGVPLLLANVVASIFPAGAIQIQLLLGGAGLIVAVAAYPAGIAGALKRLWEKVLARAAAEVTKKAEAGQGADTDVLSLRDVSVHFGGITAVDNVSIRVGREEIVGLIGANGAGKTTLVNVISGFLSGEGGTILVGGEDVTMLGPDYRAHIGIARGFQDARLFPALTVRETVQLALSREAKAGIVASLVGAPWVRFEERDTGRRADELIQALGLEPWAEVQTANLSTGTRRVCDLAAQMAAQPKLLLLDEPTAGVAQHESEALGQLLRRVAVGLGCSVLIIEHNMPVMLGGLVDRLYCLESGRIIAEGSPDEIRSNPAVIASYFGTAGAATGRRVASNGNKSEDVDGTKRAKRNPRIRATQSIRPARIKEKR